jgi:hypothetical protein
MDDAFVYFRYADNLLFLHLGLVFNQGEFVEGFSSPLWMLLLTALRATGANWWLLVRILGILCFVGMWFATLLVHRRMMPPDPDAGSRRGIGLRPLNLPLLFLSFHYGVASSFTSGLETPLVQVLACAFALLILLPRSRGLQAVVALAPLVRHQLLLPYALVPAWVVWRERRVPWTLVLTMVGTLSAWMLLRIWYYADLLPNTHYLKDEVWIAQGLRYLWDTIHTYHLYAWAAAAVAALWFLRRRGSDPLRVGERAMMLVLGLPTDLYTNKIGGDFLHFRYLAFPVVLGALAASALFERVVDELPALRRSRRIWEISVGLATAVAVSGLYPAILAGHPYTMPSQLLDGDEAIIEDAMAHRKRPELYRDPWSRGAEYDQKDEYERYLEEVGGYRFERMAADFWCVRIYERFQWYIVQSLGLWSPILARIDVEAQRPGHHWRLHPLGQQIVLVRAEFGVGRGGFARAIRAGKAPDWAVANAGSIALIEQKAYNRHRFRENLRLAFRFPERIELVSPPPEAKTHRVPRLR